jgi:hypothetical protein
MAKASNSSITGYIPVAKLGAISFDNRYVGVSVSPDEPVLSRQSQAPSLPLCSVTDNLEHGLWLRKLSESVTVETTWVVRTHAVCSGQL